VARRRLGDLLRAHGWYAEAARHYETLARLAPDDSSATLLLATAAEGLGKLEESVRWLEKLADAGSFDDRRGLARTASGLAATFLAWGRLAAAGDNKSEEVELLLARSARLLAREERSASTARVVLVWSHPELHPTLWSNALGGMMPAPEGDSTLGFAQVLLPPRPDAAIEVRVEPRDLEHAARLGAEAALTVIFDEGEKTEKVVRMPVRFTRDGAAALRFAVANKEVRP
jgi:Ca-activated chloride channel family protein